MGLTADLHALAGGALIGLAAAIALVGNGWIAGVSGIVGRAFVPGGRAFRVPFLIGLIGTGVIAAWIAPSAFGAPVRGLPMLAVAGLLVGVGTSVANGCTSGHGVCGISRGSPRSFVATATFIATGAITVALIGAHG